MGVLGAAHKLDKVAELFGKGEQDFILVVDAVL